MKSIHEYDTGVKQPPKKPAPYNTNPRNKQSKNNPVYDIEPPTHNSFGDHYSNNNDDDLMDIGSPSNGGSVTIEKGEFVDSLPFNSPNKAHVGDAQLRYYEPSEFGMQHEEDENNDYTMGDRLSPPISPAPPPGGNFSYNSSSYENDGYGDNDTINRRKPDLV